MKCDASDRRSEERKPASGEVRLFLEDPDTLEIRGNLLDQSRHGFRAAHTHAALATGSELRFRWAGAEGRARVVWNRVTGAEVVSGFFILAP